MLQEQALAAAQGAPLVSLKEAAGATEQKVRREGEGVCDELTKLIDKDENDDTGSLFQLMKIDRLLEE